MKRYVKASKHSTFYYIDGWKESESYFKSVGNFTENEWNRLKQGEIISKYDKEFWIEDLDEN